MSLFNTIPKNDFTQEFNSQEIDFLMKDLPKLEKPLHFYFRTGIRLNKQNYLNCIVCLSPHFVLIFNNESKKKNPILITNFHTSTLVMIGYSEENYKSIQTNKINIILTAPESLIFSQLLYRNYQISYNGRTKTHKCSIKSIDSSLYPELTIPFSPSQEFQFSYLSICTELNVNYSHEVVRYIHNLILSRNSIVDLSQLPFELISRKKSNSDLIPIFQSLGLLDFITGICCNNIKFSDLINTIVFLVNIGTSFKVVHISDCNATKGMKELALAVRGKKEFSVSYWDISNNYIEDIEYFGDVLSYTTTPIYYLNLSNINISPSSATYIFKVLNRNKYLWKINHLYLSHFPFLDHEVLNSFNEYLLNISKNENSELYTLDVNSIDIAIEDVLNSLISYNLNIKSLNISKCKFNQKSIRYLITFIQESKILEELNISSSNISSNELIEIINSISQNSNLNKFSIILNNLNISNYILSFIRCFLSSNKSKWISISLENNNLTEDNLLTLIPLFTRMSNLTKINLFYNFLNSGKTIGESLIKILNIKSLKTLILKGSININFGPKILPFLEYLSENSKLIEINLTGNYISNDGLPFLINLIQKNTYLNSLSIDKNNFTNIEFLNELTNSILNNNNLIHLEFPINDCNIISNSSKKESIINQLSNMQLSCISKISINRSRNNLPNELPFEVLPDVELIISNITNNSKRNYSKKNLTNHSCVSELYHIPLPFQNIDDAIVSGGRIYEINLPYIEVYNTPQLFQVIEEDQNKYQDVLYLTEVRPLKNKQLINEENLNNLKENIIIEKKKEEEELIEENLKINEEEIFEDFIDELKTKFIPEFIDENYQLNEDINEYIPNHLRKIPPLKKKILIDNDIEIETKKKFKDDFIPLKHEEIKEIINKEEIKKDKKIIPIIIDSTSEEFKKIEPIKSIKNSKPFKSIHINSIKNNVFQLSSSSDIFK